MLCQNKLNPKSINFHAAAQNSFYVFNLLTCSEVLPNDKVLLNNLEDEEILSIKEFGLN